MEIKYVDTFKLDEDDRQTILQVLDYLDPHESITFTYIGGCFKCLFSETTFVNAESFQEVFPHIIFSTK